MSYNWEFSTYGQRDKLKKIKNGEADVYNSEKELNKKTRKSYEELGLSTADIDNWDMLIDNAWESWNTNSTKNLLPKFDNSKYSAVNKAFKEANDAIKLERQQALDDAAAEEENAFSQLSEWLANNGYSDKGYTAQEAKKELRENYKSFIDAIKREYRTLSDKTRSSYFSPYLK